MQVRKVMKFFFLEDDITPQGYGVNVSASSIIHRIEQSGLNRICMKFVLGSSTIMYFVSVFLRHFHSWQHTCVPLTVHL